MIDKAKLVARIDGALGMLEVHAALGALACSLDPTYPPFIEQKGKNAGARDVLLALKQGIEEGTFDADKEDMDEAAPEETPARFGVFLRKGGRRSWSVPDDFSTRAQAWKALADAVDNDASGVSSFESYEVRPL